MLTSGVKGRIDEGEYTLEQISSKDKSQSQLGEAELTKFQNVTELTAMTIRFPKIWDSGY